jgi:hypothetical protein
MAPVVRCHGREGLENVLASVEPGPTFDVLTAWRDDAAGLFVAIGPTEAGRVTFNELPPHPFRRDLGLGRSTEHFGRVTAGDLRRVGHGKRRQQQYSYDDRVHLG